MVLCIQQLFLEQRSCRRGHAPAESSEQPSMWHSMGIRRPRNPAIAVAATPGLLDPMLELVVRVLCAIQRMLRKTFP